MILLRLSYVKCILYEASYVEKQPTRYKVRLCVYRTRVQYRQAVIEVCSVRASLSVIRDEFLWSCGRCNISIRVSRVWVSVKSWG